MSETNRIEYKRKLTNDLDIEKEVIAFLNYHEGGIIYFVPDHLSTLLICFGIAYTVIYFLII